MAGQPREIGDNAFSSKSTAEEFYRQILNKGSIGRDLDDGEFRVLMDLLALHPRVTEKIGVGVTRFSIGTSEYGTRAFLLHREDGSHEDFSYLKCIGGDHKPFSEFSRACRRSVEGRIHEWKASQMDGKTVRCAVSGEVVTFREAHVDHKPPQTFSVIVKAFTIAGDIDLLAVRYRRSSIFGVELEDTGVADAFDRFHKKMAVLRIVRAAENLRTSYAARITPTAKDGVLP